MLKQHHQHAPDAVCVVRGKNGKLNCQKNVCISREFRILTRFRRDFSALWLDVELGQYILVGSLGELKRRTQLIGNEMAGEEFALAVCNRHQGGMPRMPRSFANRWPEGGA